MKKLLLAISALSAALFSTAANADVAVSGSANAVYVDAGGNSEGHIGGVVSFALSTVTDSGKSPLGARISLKNLFRMDDNLVTILRQFPDGLSHRR